MSVPRPFWRDLPPEGDDPLVDGLVACAFGAAWRVGRRYAVRFGPYVVEGAALFAGMGVARVRSDPDRADDPVPTPVRRIGGVDVLRSGRNEVVVRVHDHADAAVRIASGGRTVASFCVDHDLAAACALAGVEIPIEAGTDTGDAAAAAVAALSLSGVHEGRRFVHGPPDCLERTADPPRGVADLPADPLAVAAVIEDPVEASGALTQALGALGCDAGRVPLSLLLGGGPRASSLLVQALLAAGPPPEPYVEEVAERIRRARGLDVVTPPPPQGPVNVPLGHTEAWISVDATSPRVVLPAARNAPLPARLAACVTEFHRAGRDRIATAVLHALATRGVRRGPLVVLDTGAADHGMVVLVRSGRVALLDGCGPVELRF